VTEATVERKNAAADISELSGYRS